MSAPVTPGRAAPRPGWRPSALVLTLTLTLALAGCARTTSEPSRLDVDSDRIDRIDVAAVAQGGNPAWGADGSLVFDGTPLVTDLPDGLAIRYAAVHRAAGYLTVVTADAQVFLLAMLPGRCTTVASYRPEEPATVRSARFCSVPGLVILLCDDVTKVGEIAADMILQLTPEVVLRVALSGEAVVSEAIPWYDAHERVLGGTYRLDGRRLALRRRSLAGPVLELPEALAEPFRGSPQDEVAQAVFVFPDNAIVCRTIHGWAVFALSGALIRFFPDEGGDGGWWHHPVLRDGELFATRQVAAHGRTFRFDLRSGVLVEQDPLRRAP